MQKDSLLIRSALALGLVGILSSCNSMKALGEGDIIGGVIGAPFEIAAGAIETATVPLSGQRQYYRRFRELGEFAAHGISPDRNVAFDALYSRIGEWTTSIPDSLADVDFNESNRVRRPEDEERVLGVDKRAINPAKFTTEFLLSIIQGGQPASASGGARTLPPLPGSDAPAGLGGFNVVADGVDHSVVKSADDMLALIRAGKVKRDTKVFNPDVAAGWVEAGSVPALAQAINALSRNLPPLPQ